MMENIRHPFPGVANHRRLWLHRLIEDWPWPTEPQLALRGRQEMAHHFVHFVS